MIILPAIDIIDGKAVRLQKGDYAKMTVYANDPAQVAEGFAEKGARYLHLVDLDGAKSGNTDNFSTVARIIEKSGMFTELGGGVRDMATVEKYLSAGVSRVIIGTAAVTDEAFLNAALDRYGEKIAVGVDIKDGFVAIRGWTELSAYSCEAFFEKMEAAGVKNVICTDVSRDGMLGGANVELYKSLNSRFSVDVTASGGVSSLEDVRALNALGMYGAILGKALYTGNVDLSEALEAVR